MALIGIEIRGAEKVSADLADLPRRLDEASRRSVAKVAIRAESIFRNKASGDVLKVRSDAYRASITSSPAERGLSGNYEARVGVRQGPASAYAKIHETGGTIHAKNKLLAIPLPILQTRAGVARSSSPRDFPDGFWFTSKAGNAIFAIKARGGLTPLFVGKESVVIPKRRPLGQTEDEVKPLMGPTFDAEFKKATGGV